MLAAQCSEMLPIAQIRVLTQRLVGLDNVDALQVHVSAYTTYRQLHTLYSIRFLEGRGVPYIHGGP